MLDLQPLGFDEAGNHPCGLVAGPSIHASLSIYHASRPQEKFHCDTLAQVFAAALKLSEARGRASGHDAVFQRLRALVES
jgi:hypothetical protein